MAAVAVVRRRAATATGPVALVILAKAALNLSFASRYGWQRDELYLAVAGRHPAAGYIDFPPITPLLARVVHALAGDSLVALRVLPVLAGSVTIVLAAQIARELGAGRLGQTMAAGLVGFSPILIATNGLFQPVSFDQVWTMLLLYLALRLALRPGPALWPLVGVTLGLGLETKYTLGVVAAVLLVSFALLWRPALSATGLALAAAIAALLMVPNLVWQLGHGWASVHFFLNPPASATDESRPQFVADLLLVTGLVSLPVALAGIRELWRELPLRPFAVTIVAVVCFYLGAGGKSYYAAPVLLFALAAGSLPFERWAARRRRRLPAFVAGVVVTLLVLLPIGVPVLPVKTANSAHVIDARSDYQDEIGWPQMAAAVERHAAGRPVVLAANYGEAGALVLFGRHLPHVASGHLSFRYWTPDRSARRGLLVGFDPSDLRTVCSSFRILERFKTPYGIDNDENGAPIASCTFRGGSLAAIWPRVVTD